MFKSCRGCFTLTHFIPKLAKEVGIASSVIQSVRSGEHVNMTLRNFIKFINALDGELTILQRIHGEDNKAKVVGSLPILELSRHLRLDNDCDRSIERIP